MTGLRSLRARVAAAAVVTVAVVLVLSGGLLVSGGEAQRLQELDAQLDRRAKILARLDDPLLGDDEARGHGGLSRFGSHDEIAVRVVRDGEVQLQAGPDGAEGLPVPEGEGFSTVEASGRTWRTRAVVAHGHLVEVAAPLDTLAESTGRGRRRALRLGLLALALTGALGWAAGGVALRPLSRLTGAARDVASTRDLSVRVPEDTGPIEVDELAANLNVMLARLEESAAGTVAALEASRRFAADAGHELRTPLTSMRANLDTLSRNPELPAAEQADILADVAAEQARLLGLLDALQALAKGDAAATPTERVDLAEVVDAAVTSARRRYPAARIEFQAGGTAIELQGWPEGLRLLVDNLIDNACRHGTRSGATDGRPGLHVRVRLQQIQTSSHGHRFATATPDIVRIASAGSGDSRISVVLEMDDDGPGIPENDRERVLKRFERGRDTRTAGSGLGLALVDQQARLHGGSVTIGVSDLGGTRATVRLAGRHLPR